MWSHAKLNKTVSTLHAVSKRDVLYSKAIESNELKRYVGFSNQKRTSASGLILDKNGFKITFVTKDK